MKKSVLANISFNAIIKLSAYFFSFVTLLYVTRVFQADAFGRSSFSSTIADYFIKLANLGLPTYAMRACAEKREDRKELSKVFNELWSISLALSIISGILLIISVIIVPKLVDYRTMIAIYGSGIIFQMMGCEWLFRGLEKFGFLAISRLLCKVASLVIIVLFVHDAGQLVLYAMLSVISSFGSDVICFFALRRYVDFLPHIHINKKHFMPLLVFFMMTCAVSVYSNIDLTMLGFWKSDYETGLYSLALREKIALSITGGLIWIPLLPSATKLWKEGEKDRFEMLSQKSLAAVCGIQALISVICMVFARQVVIFVGGESYLGAISSFRILLLSLVPIGASNILGGLVLIPVGKEKLLLRAEIVGAVINFVTNLFLIPRFSMEGAAFTTVLSEVIVLAFCVFYIKRDLQIHVLPRVAHW